MFWLLKHIQPQLYVIILSGALMTPAKSGWGKKIQLTLDTVMDDVTI